jgi:dienelactone hydrolase
MASGNFPRNSVAACKARSIPVTFTAPPDIFLQGERPCFNVPIAFEAEGGVTLRGWFYVPTGGSPYPAITMAHGCAGVKEHGLERFAEKFASNGFVVLLHDHRNFGASDGTPRQDIDPWCQIADWRCAISFLEHQDDVDAKRIGLWGTSYSGGHALVLGATERRLRAVVAQVPTISGFEQGLRRIRPDAVAAIR